MDHEGCMHPDFCVEPPRPAEPTPPLRVLATITISEEALPLRFATRDHLADMLSMYACELRKGEHVGSRRVEIFEDGPGVGPYLLIRYGVGA